MDWESTANMCQSVYGVYVNWEKRFFMCPDCDKPIYECDWEDEDFAFCPICEFEWEDEE